MGGELRFAHRAKARAGGIALLGLAGTALALLAMSPARALNPATATTTTGQTLSVQINSPTNGSTVALGAQNVSGVASITALPPVFRNLITIIDTSGSTSDNPHDCNGDSVAGNAPDDFRPGNEVGSILDCEVAGAIALNNSITSLANTDVGIVSFATAASTRDMNGATAGTPVFTTPTADVQPNGARDFDEAAKAVPQSTGSTNYDAALTQMNTNFATQPAGETNIAFFLSDGLPSTFDTTPPSPLATAAAAGTKIYTFAINQPASACQQTPTVAPLRQIANDTGGTCTVVTNPAAISAAITGVLAATITKVEVNCNGGAFTLATGTTSWNASGICNVAPHLAYVIRARVTASDGTTATADITVNGPNRPPVANNDAYTTGTNTPLTVPAPGVLTNDTDADGDTLTVTTTGAVATTSGGSATRNANGSFTYTPATNYCGPDSFSYSIADGFGGTASATVNITVTCRPILALTKTADSSPVNAGSPIGYTIALTNTGNGPATTVQILDNLPTAGGLSWTISPAVSGCGIASNVLTCNFASVANGSGVSVHVTSSTSPANCTAPVSNTATYSAANSTPTGGSSNTSLITVNCPALVITKLADASPVNAGNPIGYTIKLTNNGLGSATGVVITDNLPTNPGLSWSMSPAVSGCGIASNVLTCNFLSLGGGGAFVSIHVTSPTTTATCPNAGISNTASYTSTNAPPGNSGAATVINVTCPILGFSKTADSGTVTAGNQIGYTLAFTNTGTGAATNVVLTDNLPTNPGLSWSINPANAACGIVSNVLSCTFPSIPGGGGTASVHIISPTTAATCPNTGISNTASYTSDNAPSGNSGAATVITVQCPALSFSKTADSGTVNAGDQIGYTLAFTNNGTGAATVVVLTDNLPTNPGLSWSISPANAACGIASNVLSCTFPSIAGGGGTASVHIISPTTAATCPNTGISNTASYTSTNGPGGNSGAATVINVTCPVLGMTKTADASSVSAGSPIGYTITVNNTGTGAATNVVVTDNLPTNPGLSWSISPANGACGIALNVLSCTFPTIAGPGAASVHIISPTTAATCAGPVNNTASYTADNAPSGNSGAATGITVNCPILGMTKTADASSVSAGSPIGYTITVNNTGTGAATNVIVTDNLPTNAGLSWSISPPNGACGIGSNVLTCTFPTIAGPGSASVHITSPTTAATCGSGPVSNAASFTADNAPSGNSGTATGIVVNCPNLALLKTADASPVIAPNPIGFTIKITNNGVGDAANVVVTDSLPTNAGLSWSISPAVTGCSITTNVLTCNFGTITGGGAFKSVHITSATTIATCQSGPISNTATGSASNNPTTIAPSSASITVTCPASCEPNFTPTTVVTGNQGNVVVYGNTLIKNATITGGVQVNSGANVFIQNTTIAGGTTSNSAASFYMFDTTTSQNVGVMNTSGPVVIGNNASGVGKQGLCGPNNLQSLSVQNNRGGVSIGYNTVKGGVSVHYNNAPSFLTIVRNNKIGGSLGCVGNNPPASNAGGANTVTGARSGECSSATF